MCWIDSPSSIVLPDTDSCPLWANGMEIMDLTQRLMDVVTVRADVSRQAEVRSECCGV